jgi:hypothetical protein
MDRAGRLSALFHIKEADYELHNLLLDRTDQEKQFNIDTHYRQNGVSVYSQGWDRDIKSCYPA